MATRQAGLSCPYFRFMQAVIFGTSGMNSEHSRIASGVQACCASGLPWASARSSPYSDTPANNASKQMKRTIGMGIPPSVRAGSENRLGAAKQRCKPPLTAYRQACLSPRPLRAKCPSKGGESTVCDAAGIVELRALSRERVSRNRPAARDYSLPQVKPRPLRRNCPLRISSGQGSTSPSFISDVLLSKDR